MKIRNSIFSILFKILVSFTNVLAGTRAGTSAADFLNIGVSARSAATGGALTAISDGPTSCYYNPAGLATVENIQVAGMHSEWLQDLRYEYIGYAMPTGQRGGLGLSFSYLSMGEIKGYSATNTPTGDISAYDMATGLSYGYQISPALSVGLGAKWINEKLDDITASGIAGDIGLQYRSFSYAAGLSLVNLGPKIKYAASSSPLPTAVNAGFAYYPFGSNLAIMVGGVMPFYGDFAFKGGLEYTYNSVLSLRSGYDSENRGDSQNGISFGAGLNILNNSLDYAYNINNAMGGTHQISFVLRFGQARQSKSFQRTEPTVIPSQDQPAAKVEPIQEQPVVEIKPPEIQPIAPTEPIPVQPAAQIEPLQQQPIAQVIPVSIGEPVAIAAPTLADSVKTDSAVVEKAQPVKISKPVYMVCAGRFGNKETADKNIMTLRKFGYSPKLYFDGKSNYWVVLGEAGGMKKAEKMKKNFDEEGLNCIIEAR